MSSTGRILVVGAGIAGLSTAWALTRRGYHVDLFEQGSIPNPRSSSHDEHRVTRHAYGDFTGYARLMPAAFAAYKDLFSDIGARHFVELPMLVLQRETISWYANSLTSMDELGIAYRDVPVSNLAERYPMLKPEGVSSAYECSGAGMLFPIRILTDLVVHLSARGVRFYPGTQIDAVDPDAGTVRSGAQVHAGDAVVVAAGAWAERLVPTLASVVTPSRQTVVYLAPPPDLAEAWRKAPVMLDLGIESGTYTLPPQPGTRLKVGDHHFKKAGDPDDDRVARDADIERLVTAACLGFRDFDRYTMLEKKICYYTVTEDESFVVRPIGDRGYVQSACSGHGFKLAPLIGQGVARAIAGEISGDDLAEWAAGREPRGMAAPAA